MIKALLWDMDGTLVDSEPLHERALLAAAREAGLPHIEDLHDQVVGMSADAVYDWMCRAHGLEKPFADWIRSKYAAYMATLDEVVPIPGALETWAAVEAAGIGQAVASNSDRIVVEANLGRVGLIAPGRISVSRNDIRKGKPDPEIYLRAAYLLGVDPAEAAVVEDSATGARAGLAAGMRTFLVPGGSTEAPDAVHRLKDFADLRAALGLA